MCVCVADGDGRRYCERRSIERPTPIAPRRLFHVRRWTTPIAPPPPQPHPLPTATEPKSRSRRLPGFSTEFSACLAIRFTSVASSTTTTSTTSQEGNQRRRRFSDDSIMKDGRSHTDNNSNNNNNNNNNHNEAAPLNGNSKRSVVGNRRTS